MQPTFTKSNARYRGPTYSSDYANIINEIVHDIYYIYHKSVAFNEKPGHMYLIENNLYYSIDKSKAPSEKPIVNTDSIYDMISAIEDNKNILTQLETELIEL